MADLTVTAADVLKGSNAQTKSVTAGASVSQGEPVYQDTDDNNERKPAAAGDTQIKANCEGIALNAAEDGQPLTILTSGDLDPGATLTVGETYVVSTTAGGIAPFGDLSSTNYVTVLGVADAAGNLAVDIQVSGIQKA